MLIILILIYDNIHQNNVKDPPGLVQFYLEKEHMMMKDQVQRKIQVSLRNVTVKIKNGD